MGGQEQNTHPSVEAASMENAREEKTSLNDEPGIKYGGVKAMPFVIGKHTQLHFFFSWVEKVLFFGC